MRLVESVLTRIHDDDLIGEAIEQHPCVAELVDSYNKIAKTKDRQAGGKNLASGSLTGLTFKRYIGYLTPAEQFQLLAAYLKHFNMAGEEVVQPTVERAESDSVKEERRLKHWMVKTVFIFCLGLTFVVIGATVAVMVSAKVLPDSGVVKALMTTAVEVIKLLFSK